MTHSCCQFSCHELFFLALLGRHLEENNWGKSISSHSHTLGPTHSGETHMDVAPQSPARSCALRWRPRDSPSHPGCMHLPLLHRNEPWSLCVLFPWHRSCAQVQFSWTVQSAGCQSAALSSPSRAYPFGPGDNRHRLIGLFRPGGGLLWTQEAQAEH